MKTEIERYYVFYTGPASTPFSIGIMDNKTGNEIKRVGLWDLRTGKQIRAEYNRLSAEFKTECNTLNQTK